MKQSEFNTIIVEIKGHAEDPPGVQNWVATQFGRRLAGCEIECDNLPKVCPVCQRPGPDIAKRRLNAAYADDDLNWLVSCRDCFDERQDQLGEMWDDYYSMVL